MEHQNMKYEERQPSSDAREELIAVIDYLFQYAYDEKHLSRNKEIIDFAREKYEIYFRRERVCGILIHLEQMYKNNPKLFPFTLNVKRYKNSSKYYVTNVCFSDRDAIDLIISLRNDSSKSQARVLDLQNKILKRVGGKEKQKILLEKINKNRIRTAHIPTKEESILDLLKTAAQSKMYISFKLHLWYEFEISNEWAAISKEIVTEKILNGYVHSINYFEKEQWVAIYLPSYKATITAPIESIELITSPTNLGKNIDFSINHEKFKTTDEWLDNLYKGKTLIQKSFLLGIYKDETKKIKVSFENYFDTSLEPLNNASGCINFNGKNISFNSDYTYAKITCNPASLYNWLTSEKNVLFNVTIIEPQDIKFGFDELLIKTILAKRKRLGLSNENIFNKIKALL